MPDAARLFGRKQFFSPVKVTSKDYVFFFPTDSKGRDLIGWIKSHLAERNEAITAENFFSRERNAGFDIENQTDFEILCSSVHFSITNLDLSSILPARHASNKFKTSLFPLTIGKCMKNTKNNNQKTKRNVIIYETVYFRAIFWNTKVKIKIKQKKALLNKKRTKIHIKIINSQFYYWFSAHLIEKVFFRRGPSE